MSIQSSKTNLTVAVAFIGLLIASLLSYRQAIASASSARWTVHTNQVLQLIQSLRFAEESIESSARGYALTGDPVYRVKYNTSVADVHQNLTEIRALTIDNPDQQQRLTTLQKLISEKIKASDALIDLRESSGLAAAAADIVDSNDDTTSQFLFVAGRLQEEETRLVTLRETDAHHRILLSRISLIVASLLGLLVAATALFGSYLDRSARGSAELALLDSEDKYRGLLEAAPDAMVVLDHRGKIALLNLQVEMQFGYRRDELLGQDVTHIIPVGFAERITADALRSTEDALTQQIGTGIELNGRRKDGTQFPIEIMLSPLKGVDGVLTTAAIRDISVRKRAEAALYEEKVLAQVTLNCIGDSIACTDTSGRITFLNIAAEIISGWSFEEAKGMRIGEVFAIRVADQESLFPSPISFAFTCEKLPSLPANAILTRRDLHELPVEQSIAPMHDSHGVIIGAVVVLRDVSVARALANQVVYAAEHDYLTGLPNRLLLNDRIAQSISHAERHEKKVAIMFLDLDGFKHVNDSLGHPVGDKLLQAVAMRLLACVRATDTVSRQGGDEFVILLSEVNHPEESLIVSKRLLESTTGTFKIDDNELHITASIGVSVFPDDGMDAETLIKNADTAMYQAKENGRQLCQMFEPAMSVRAVERQSIQESLRQALQHEQFSLQYQPKIDLLTGQITGAEALLRWTHPTRGPIPPDRFIPIAEECGLILPISRWVLREACRQAQEWTNDGLPPISMAVNISAIDFRDHTFLSIVSAILDETGYDPTRLELELTEGVLMKQADAAEATLKALKAKGIKLAVDDFGTGYSSLSYLRQFSLDTLKIDKSFIRQIGTNRGENTIVTAMIGMGQSLKLRVVAEGVETQEELDFLHGCNCDEAQGYFFSRPVPPQKFKELLTQPSYVLA